MTPSKTRCDALHKMSSYLILFMFSMFVVFVPAQASTGGEAWTVKAVEKDDGGSRPNFNYAVEPGKAIEDTMVVTNTGTIPLTLDVYAADAFTTSTGDIDVLPAGDSSSDAGTWVSVDSSTLSLRPGQAKDITFTLKVPRDATPGDHVAGIVTSLTSDDPTQTLQIDRRLGMRVNVRVAGEFAPSVKVSSVAANAKTSWNPLKPTVVRVTYQIENTGNTRIAGTDTVNIRTFGGLIKAALAGTQIPEILPRSTVEIIREVPITSLGRVSGTLTVAPQGVGLGAGDIEAEVVDVSTLAIPWTLYIGVAAFTGLLIWILVTLRSRARANGSSQPISSD